MTGPALLKGRNMRLVSTTIYMSASQRKRLKQRKEATGVPWAHIVREAIETELDRLDLEDKKRAAKIGLRAKR
jgi:predicted DNA-binding protein